MALLAIASSSVLFFPGSLREGCPNRRVTILACSSCTIKSCLQKNPRRRLSVLQTASRLSFYEKLGPRLKRGWGRGGRLAQAAIPGLGGLSRALGTCPIACSFPRCPIPLFCQAVPGLQGEVWRRRRRRGGGSRGGQLRGSTGIRTRSCRCGAPRTPCGGRRNGRDGDVDGKPPTWAPRGGQGPASLPVSPPSIAPPVRPGWGWLLPLRGEGCPFLSAGICEEASGSF